MQNKTTVISHNYSTRPKSNLFTANPKPIQRVNFFTGLVICLNIDVSTENGFSFLCFYSTFKHGGKCPASIKTLDRDLELILLHEGRYSATSKCTKIILEAIAFLPLHLHSLLNIPTWFSLCIFFPLQAFT